MDSGRRLWKVKYEAEAVPAFADQIAAIPGGEKLFTCIQCGTCGGTCPVSHHMDYTPRRIIAMIRAGFKQEVLTSFTTWLCASCYSCTVECPKGIKITDIMYALKRLAIQENAFPSRFPIPILAREFHRMVLKHGRNNESFLTVRLFLKTNPFLLFKQTILGWKLWRQGRMGLKTESIERKKELRSLLGALENSELKSPITESKTTVGEAV